MHNYKALKSAGKVSVSKDGDKLQTVKKVYDTHTGEESTVTQVESLGDVAIAIERCKSRVASLEAEQADLEQLETDLKAL